MAFLRPLALGLALCPAVLPAQEVPALGQVERVTEGLIATAIAYEIDRRCPELDGRMGRGLAFLLSLQAHARSLGFSQDEVDAYIDDDVEKERLIAIARERFAAMGGVEGQEASYCAVGRAEIAADSQIGRLLSD